MKRTLIRIILAICVLSSINFIFSVTSSTTVTLNLILPVTYATPTEHKFLDDWYDTRFEMIVESEDIWNLPGEYAVTVTINITDMGDNEYLWLNRIKVKVGYYVEEDLLVDQKLTQVGDTYSATLTLKSDDSFKYLEPDESSSYTLSIEVTGEVKDLRSGSTWSDWTYESFKIDVYSPPAPITISEVFQQRRSGSGTNSMLMSQ